MLGKQQCEPLRLRSLSTVRGSLTESGLGLVYTWDGRTSTPIEKAMSEPVSVRG